MLFIIQSVYETKYKQLSTEVAI